MQGKKKYYCNIKKLFLCCVFFQIIKKGVHDLFWELRIKYKKTGGRVTVRFFCMSNQFYLFPPSITANSLSLNVCFS